MDFDYTEEQRYLRDEAHRFLAAHCPPAAARHVLDDPTVRYDASLWASIGAQGWLGITIPASHGGLGLGHVELAAIAEAIGAAIAPVPFGSTLYLFAEAIMTWGSDVQRRALLPAIAAGELIGCAALSESAGEIATDGIDARVVDGRLTGVKYPVVDGGIADMAIVLARGADGPALFVVALDQPGIERTALEAIDGSVDIARIAFHDVAAEPLIGTDAASVTTLLTRAAALYAFEQVGGADRCLARATDHAKERHAFGGPIGRFQAVKHKLADLYVANALARSHAYHGVWALDDAPDRLLQAAATARIASSDAYWTAAKEAIHLHGAIGFTWAHDAHLFYRRAHHLSLVVGSPTWWKDRLFEALAADRQPANRAADIADAIVEGPLTSETV